MADNQSDKSSLTEGNQDSQIKEMETNEESTGFDVTESESPVAHSDQSSSCPSSELSIRVDKSASITEPMQMDDESTNEMSAENSDLSGEKLPASSTSSTAENANMDETQISIDSSMTKSKHFTSSISAKQTDATISNVLKRVSDMDSTDISSQATSGLSTSAEEFQEILTSSHSKESENKKEDESTIDPAENPVERIVDSPSEEESVGSEAVLMPGGSKKPIFSRISVESTIDKDENPVERMVDSPSEEESVGSEAILLPGGSKKTILSRIKSVKKSVQTAIQTKLLHVARDSSSGSSPVDAASKRKSYQSLHESVDSTTGAVFNSMDSTSSESSFPDEEVGKERKTRDRIDSISSYEKAMANTYNRGVIGRGHECKEEKKKKENESESEDEDDEEFSAPAKRPALDRRHKKDDDDDDSTPVAVVTSFFICWTPFHAQRLLAIYTIEITPTLLVTFTILTYISGVTYYLSATLNPILYKLLSGNFRQAFKDTFGCCQTPNKSNSRGTHLENSRYRVAHQVKVPLDSSASRVSNASVHHDHS